MTEPGGAAAVLRDDAVLRTRQSWLRTGLGLVAVTLLLVRGLIVDDAPRWLALVAVVPGATAVALSVVRGRALAAASQASGSPPSLDRHFRPYAMTVCLTTVAAVAVALAVG